MASEAYKKLDYRVVHPANQSLVMDEEYWPADTRWIRAAFLASYEGKTQPEDTPRFILAKGGKIILTVTGNADWKDRMWPVILEVTWTKG